MEKLKRMKGSGKLYIPEFVCGIIATIAVEILAIIIFGIYHSKNK
jgi:hypothetical protein